MAPATATPSETPQDVPQPALRELKEELLTCFSKLETSILENVSAQ